MARRPPVSGKLPRTLRRARAFALLNAVAAAAVGAWYLFQPAARQQEVAALVRNAFDDRKGITALDVAWDLWQLYHSDDFVRGVAPGDRTHVYGGVPVPASAATSQRVLVNTGYVVGYSDALGNPLWAAYRIRDVALDAAPPRPDGFTADLRTAARIEAEAYSRSDYDRGHLAPNYAIATRYGRRAQEETFQMSNVIPQRHALNAGVWKRLEQRIATAYPGRFGEIWVLAGPVFGPNPPRLRRRVAVPEACYMILLDESDGRLRAQAFVFPQETPAFAEPDGYLVTIDEVERRTGLDFLPELPDELETALEARRPERAW